MEINPNELEKWIAVLWNIGLKGLLVFAVIYYRDTVSHLINSFVDVFVSIINKVFRLK